MTRLLRAELLRLFATPSRVVITLLGLGLALGSAIAVSVLARQAGLGLIDITMQPVTWFVSVTVAVLAAFIFGGDWGNRSIIHSFTHANRSAVLATKVLLLIGLVVVSLLVVLAQLAIIVLPPAPQDELGATLDFGQAVAKVLPVVGVKTLLLALFGAAVAAALTSMWGGVLVLSVGTFLLDAAAKVADLSITVSQRSATFQDVLSPYTPNNAFQAVATASAPVGVILAALGWIAVPWAIGVWRWLTREV